MHFLPIRTEESNINHEEPRVQGHSRHEGNYGDNMPLRLIASLLVAGALTSSATAAPAIDEFPSRSVRLVVGFAPGGPADAIARIVAQGLSELWKQTVYVENRVGASGAIALRTATNAPSDGYTILVTSNSQIVSQLMAKTPSYDMVQDLIPTINVGSTPMILVASNALGAKSLKSVIELSQGRKLNFGTAGAGSAPHLTFAYLLNGLAHTDSSHIPYSGAGPALNAVMGDQIDLAGLALTPVIPVAQSGRVVPLAITSTSRLADLPDVPTVAEQGYPEFESSTWIGLFVASGTPRAINDKINASIQQVIDTPSYREKIKGQGFTLEGGTASQFNSFVIADFKRWQSYLEAAGIKPE